MTGRQKNLTDRDWLKRACEETLMQSGNITTKTGVIVVRGGVELIIATNTRDASCVEGLLYEPDFEHKHAHSRAIILAGRERKNTKGGIMYSPIFPCESCVPYLIRGGITQVVTHKNITDYIKSDEPNWGKSHDRARALLARERIKIVDILEPLGKNMIRYKGGSYDI